MTEEIIDIIVHLDSSVVTGVFNLPKGRLSDFLNSSVKFIRLTDASVIKSDGSLEKVEEILINKETIKMLATVSRDAGRGYGADYGTRKKFPFMQKVPVAARMQLTGYELNGNIHCKNKTTVSDLLERDFTFLPCTDLQIRNTQDNTLWKASFAAINRTKISMLQQVAAS